MQTQTIALIDDDRNILTSISIALEKEGFKVQTYIDGESALIGLTRTPPDLAVIDIKMPKMDGVEVLEKTKKIKPETPIVMISGHGDLDTAVNTMRLGAFDYISKPPDLNRLLNTVRNALEKKTLVVENKRLKKKVSKNYEMIGESNAITHIKEIIEKVAVTDARVLITGPNGTGKELVAHWLHEKSERVKAPMIEVNCAAIPSELIESELFGHVKGSFTGANKDRAGKFEAANGGTIFLDEIGDMSLSAQAKVLRALQENKISRVGSDKDIKVNVRVVAATNKNIKEEIAKGRFREDLYHRLAVILIKVPALNDRREDIPLLVDFFTKKISDAQGTPKKEFSKEAIKLLQEYDWTGNIRELRNVIERLIILGEKKVSEKDVKLFASK